MYPTIHSNSNAGVSTSYLPQQPINSDSRDSRSLAANGPSQLTSAPSNSNALPVLRVQIAEHLSISPPVRDQITHVNTARLTAIEVTYS